MLTWKKLYGAENRLMTLGSLTRFTAVMTTEFYLAKRWNWRKAMPENPRNKNRVEPKKRLQWCYGPVTIQIIRNEKEEACTLQARVLEGVLAVHNTRSEEKDPPKWTVTHVSSGLSMARFNQYSDATRFAEECWNLAADAL